MKVQDMRLDDRRRAGHFEVRWYRWQWWRGILLMLAALLTWPVFPGIARAAERADVPAEYQAKAAFLLNFTRFINWPEQSFATADTPFVVGILGDNPFGSVLAETLRDERVRGRKVELRFFASIM